MIDEAIDLLTNDMLYVNGDEQLVKDAQGSPLQILQNIQIRLRFIKGEWFLDTTLGCIDFKVLAQKNKVKDTIDAAVKSTIVDTPGVSALQSYSSTLSNRALAVTFTVNTIYGSTQPTTTTIGI